LATKKATVTPTIQPRLLNIEDAAAYLSTTVWAMRKLVWAKDVPHIKLGTRLLIDKQDLDSFINHAKLGGKFGTACNAAGMAR
jgi:excisionase family DNA binding protein